MFFSSTVIVNKVFSAECYSSEKAIVPQLEINSFVPHKVNLFYIIEKQNSKFYCELCINEVLAFRARSRSEPFLWHEVVIQRCSLVCTNI